MSETIKEISEAELPDNLRQLWLKALSAVEVNNPEYAASLLHNILKESPGFLKGRKTLRKCQIHLSKGKKKGGGLFGLKSGGLSLMKISSHSKKDPLGALPLIEKELDKDPFNEQANDLLYETFMLLNMVESATFALETVRKGKPKNTKLLHKLAEHYLARDMPAEASEVYNDIVGLDPTDSDAIKGAKDASARASMKKQRWEQADNVRDLMKDESEVEELEKASRAGMTRDQLEAKRDQLIAKYNEDQNDLATVKELAATYENLEDWPMAASFYDWAHQLSKGDVALENKASIMRDKAAEFEMQKLKEAMEADPDNEELRREYEEKKSARLTEQVEIARKRVDQNPTDPQLRFEYGQALYYAGDYGEAIPQLQQATRNPHIRTRVLLLLGRTFRAKKMFDLAIKQLSDALADLHVMDSTKKEVLYEKGLIHEEMGDKEKALDCFKQIYEVDYGYRDVAQRVESAYQG